MLCQQHSAVFASSLAFSTPMQSTLYAGDRFDWLVVGSNGLIGNEISAALRRSKLTSGLAPLAVETYASPAYGKHNLDLLAKAQAKPIRIFFCAGKGGFSIGQDIATKQIDDLKEFSRALIEQGFLIDKFILISSLGCLCTRHQINPYSRLNDAKESFVTSFWNDRSLIIRLPSMYGFNQCKKNYGGMIGVMINNLRQRRCTGVYGRLETRRNYLSSSQLSASLFSDLHQHHLDQQGVLNVQAEFSVSIFDLCSLFFKLLKMRPAIKLMAAAAVDSESHYPFMVKGAKLILNDQLEHWIHQEWMRAGQQSPS